MWRKEDGNPQASPELSPNPVNSANIGRPGFSPLSTQPVSSNAPACVSQGIKIKGDVTGTEDLFVDGVIEGKITLANSTVTVGPNGSVKAEINAREVVVRGAAEGKFTATERIQIWHTARVYGDLKSERISIEEGAELRGKVEAGKPAGTAPPADAQAHTKKSEASKAKDTVATDANATSGAATAGAD
jgi:cytoskeletal protein CcmA (bactofilin family)